MIKMRSSLDDIKPERKCSITKYHVEEREETDLKARFFISSLLKKASLVGSEWAVFPQTHLDNSSIGPWRGVPNFTMYGGEKSLQ